MFETLLIFKCVLIRVSASTLIYKFLLFFSYFLLETPH